jgi:hypothetical protein
MVSNKSICIVGPSKLFLSGISYYTISLANAMSEKKNVSIVCFRQLLPTFLFPGKSHVGKNISDLNFSPDVPVFDGMDYNNPLTWIRAYRFLKNSETRCHSFAVVDFFGCTHASSSQTLCQS